MVNAATGPDAQEQQGSSEPVSEQPDGQTASPLLVRGSGSASRARPEMLHGWCTLSMAAELLSYRPAPDRHNDKLQRIEELVATAGDPAALSFSFRPQPSLANDEEQDARSPPPQPGARPEPRKEARPRDRPREPTTRPGDEASCQVVPQPCADARALSALQIARREHAPLEGDLLEQ
ncbi:hypothetical protein D1007_52181 [Hordeum vulgare]|nr:hypothetical protein D1007_52181 [Hordeum vulgare]